MGRYRRVLAVVMRQERLRVFESSVKYVYVGALRLGTRVESFLGTTETRDGALSEVQRGLTMRQMRL